MSIFVGIQIDRKEENNYNRGNNDNKGAPMHRKLMLSISFVFLFHCACFAQTVYLKDGKSIQGQIVEKTDKFIKLNVKGVTLTYYNDEIERIDGVAAQGPAAATAIKPYASSAAGAQTKPGVGAKPSAADNKVSSPLGDDPALSAMSKQELILMLISASGAKENMNQMFNEIIAQVSPEEAQKLKGVFDVDDVISQLVPVYDKYFTEDELRGIIAFYKGPLGRKLIMVTPLIMQDSAEVSLMYFQNKIQPIESP